MKQIGITGALVLLIALSCSIFSVRIGSSVGRSIETAAHQRAADRSQARQERDQWHRLAMEEARQTASYRIAAKRATWYWLSIFGIGSGATIMVTGVLSVAWWMIGRSRAAVERSRREARLIPVDPETRQFPLFVYELAGAPRIYNPNTGSVVTLEAGRDEIPMLITGSSATQLAGAIAQQAAKAQDAGSVAMISPPLVVEDK
jgi:hypothetical protein